MTIRNAEINDVEKLAVLFDAYRIFYEQPSNKKEAYIFLFERITHKESRILIATEADELVGFVQLYPIFSSTKMKKLWLLNDLYILEKNRGHGISKQLIEKCKDLCKETKAVGILLETAKTNKTGNSLYTKTGFNLDVNHNYYSWNNY